MSLDDSATPQRILPGYGGDLPIMTPSGQWDWTRVEGGFSKREAAAIALRIPESGDSDLDAMIRKAQRQDLAAMAMQGMLGGEPGSHLIPNNLAAESVVYADGILAALAQAKQGKEGGEG